MKERPILFKGEMVRAILEGRKTQTRRPVKPQPSGPRDEAWDSNMVGPCPFGQPGDRLWVRETYAIATGNGQYQVYRADAIEDDSGERSGFWIGDSFYSYEGTHRWFPSIHMPRRASRITLEITDVRVQRLQEISEEEAEAEGTALWSPSGGLEPFNAPQRKRFSWLWNSIYAAQDFGWDQNPWVWAISFRRLP